MKVRPVRLITVKYSVLLSYKCFTNLKCHNLESKWIFSYVRVSNSRTYTIVIRVTRNCIALTADLGKMENAGWMRIFSMPKIFGIDRCWIPRLNLIEASKNLGAEMRNGIHRIHRHRKGLDASFGGTFDRPLCGARVSYLIFKAMPSAWANAWPNLNPAP